MTQWLIVTALLAASACFAIGTKALTAADALILPDLTRAASWLSLLSAVFLIGGWTA